MDNFIVSARKYRPATFDSMVGQDHITSTLKNAIRNNKLAQAFLFTGPRGVGKTTCARIFAKTINCMNLSDNIEPCNACESCLSFNRSASFNIFELDAASNSSVDDIRLLVEQVRIPPQKVRYKVYIIDEVHMLSQQAFNAFLKTLEEPPEYAKFILATTEKHKIIPTILSRCQIYDFKRITISDITRYLSFVAEKEGIKTEPEALSVIASKADGALRDALSIFDQLVSFAGGELTYKLVVEHLNVLDYEYYFKITDFLLDGNIYDCLLTFNKVIESGFDGQHFISGLASHFRDLLVCTDNKTVELLELSEKIRERYLTQAVKTSPEFLIKALDIIQKTDFEYRLSNNKRLHIEIALMQLASISNYLTLHPKQTQLVTPPPKKTDNPTQKTTLPPPSSKPTSIPPKPQASKGINSNLTPSKTTSANINEPKKPAFIPSTISIKDEIIQTDEPQETDETESFDFESDEFLNARKIQPEHLHEAWNDFAAKISESHPNLYSTLISTKPDISEDFEITFEVSNSLQQKELYSLKRELISYLRDELSNNFIRLKVLLNAAAAQSKPYTPEEIYQHFVEKNPVVATLKQKLDLTTEY
ncbi:MAG TPA: DNA polymerase III subunit gamma/tau [Bacteroidales bacterium]|nr:DNA polymerase III subunit gamma/tau [Bacteroidales bacterium]HPR57327.1 DNA polymerase III subunit gamma/tau [Bacteroidales bacterium]HRW97155.1 DNA polymerase III subunit gamma/tau [Bacteroidales bacterium]